MTEYDKGVKDTILIVLGTVFYTMTCISWANFYTGAGLLFVVTYIIIPLIAFFVAIAD